MSKAKVSIVIGMQYGDEGKGMSVNRLFSSKIISPTTGETIAPPTMVVKFNGSSQAAHNVTNRNGTHHTFHQVGSGYLSVPHLTYLHRTFFVDPLRLINECEELDKKVKILPARAIHNIRIHEQAPILLPIYGFINRLEEEARGRHAHGSCGRGVGVLAKSYFDSAPIFRHNQKSNVRAILEDVVRYHKENVIELLKKAPFNSRNHDDYRYYFGGEFVVRYSDWLKTNYFPAVRLKNNSFFNLVLGDAQQHVVFEGAQGILLDEWRGFHPHTTWSSTNLRIPHQLMNKIAYDGEYHTYGALKAFGTRHGHGPFPGEDKAWKSAPSIDAHNTYGKYQGDFRLGAFDAVALRYALKVAKDNNSKYRGIDSFQVSCLDIVRDKMKALKVVDSYDNGEIRVNPNLVDIDEQEKIGNEVRAARPTSIIEYPVNTFDFGVPGLEEQIPISHRSYSARDSGEEIIYADYRS